MSKITTERHYKITLTGGSTYYGRTTLGDKRYELHKSWARQGTHPCLQESYDKYGYDGWVHEWLGWETGDKLHHDKIEYGRVQTDPKSLNIQGGRYVLLDRKEYERRAYKSRRDNMSPEEIEEFNRRSKEEKRRKVDNMSPEELRAYRLKTNKRNHKNNKRKRNNKL